MTGERSPNRWTPPLLALALGALAWLGPAGPTSAGLRVLLAFDAAGHRVHRVSDDGVDERLLSSRRGGSIDPAAAIAAGDAVLVWRDEADRVLAIDRASDPRLGHAPAGREGATPGGRVALADGAWLARGPSGARTLELRLPARGEPALALERWRLTLDGAGVP